MAIVNLRCRAQGERPPATRAVPGGAAGCSVLSHPSWGVQGDRDSRAEKAAVGQWVGALRIDDIVGPLRATTCLCGGRQFLSVGEIDRAFNSHVGCCRESCSQRTLLTLVWGSVEESLKVQWKLLQACYGSQIPSFWGGKLDDLYPSDPEPGVARALQEVLLPLRPVGEIRWIQPTDPEKPFIHGNLKLANRPWTGLVGFNCLSLEIAGQRVAITDLCAQLGVTPAQVVQKVADNTRDLELLTLILAQEGAV